LAPGDWEIYLEDHNERNNMNIIREKFVGLENPANSIFF